MLLRPLSFSQHRPLILGEVWTSPPQLPTPHTMLNVKASAATRAAYRRLPSNPLLAKKRSFAVQAPQRVAAPLQSETSLTPPTKIIEKFTSNEFPDRQEPPLITRSIASEISLIDSKLLSPTKYTISTTRRIGPDRPSHIPPNVPQESLRLPDLEVTTLPNGVRVGSIENYSRVSSVGVLLDFGSRHEVDRLLTTSNPNSPDNTHDDFISTSGVNHLMELLAFQSTKNHTGEEVRNTMERLGGSCFATSAREQMMYCVDVLRPNVGAAFHLLADTIKYPLIDDVEVEEMKRAMEYQIMDVQPQILMGEGLQMAGYGPLPSVDDGGIIYEMEDGTGNMNMTMQQLGRPHFCTPESLPNLTAQSVHAFRECHLINRPNGIVVSGSGISHDALVQLAEANFGHIPASSSAASSSKYDEKDRTIPSVYTGGEYRLERPPNPNPAKEEFAHVAVAFEVGGWHSPDLVPTCVLQTLLGGGSSFSAGGPGKGMYSRLYREVLNRYHWAESCEAFTSFHGESGLFGMAGSARPDKAGEMTRALVEHFLKLEAELVTDEELDRARNMLRCNVLTQLESRLVLFEDIGRQILTYSKREDAATMCAKIDNVTKEDIQRVVRKAVRKPPTLSTVGINVKNVPRVEEISRWLGRGPQSKKSWF